MFGVGFWEAFVIVIIALMLFGPKEMVSHVKRFSEILRQMRRYKDEFLIEIQDVTRNVKDMGIDPSKSQLNPKWVMSDNDSIPRIPAPPPLPDVEETKHESET